MIVNWFVQILAAVLNFVVGLFGSIDAPSWLTGASSTWQSIIGYAAGLDPWVPWSLMGTVVLAVVSCLGISFGIKVVRIVLSLFTAGGGSAG